MAALDELVEALMSQSLEASGDWVFDMRDLFNACMTDGDPIEIGHAAVGQALPLSQEEVHALIDHVSNNGSG